MSVNNKVPLSVCMIVKNEERRLEDALKSVQWAEEIVIIDDDSTDRTVEIAKKYTDKIVTRTMDIEGRQRNFSFEQASSEWLLSLDADERVTPELAESIRQNLSKPTDLNGFDIPVKTFIGERWVKGAGYYPARKLRIFRRGKFQYEEEKVHPRAFLDGESGSVDGDLLHYSCQNLTQFITKFNRETTLEAEKWIRDGRKVSMWNLLRKTVDRFLKFYFIKGGFKDGFTGYLMSSFHSLYQLHSYAKYREMTQGKL
jgi:glycosyltransferase involved in cell wall biosynthesis